MVTLSVGAAPSTPPSPPARREPGRLVFRGAGAVGTVAAVCGFFGVIGVGTVMLGPTLPLLAARWNLPDARLGSLFVASFAGQFCGAWLATPRLRASLVGGAVVAGSGMALLAFCGAAVAHLALFCAGLGLGAGMTAGNVLVGTLGPSRAAILKGLRLPANSSKLETTRQEASSRSRNLALLNVAWGLGAIACPLLLDFSLRARAFSATPGRLLFASLAAALAGCAALLAVVLPRQAAVDVSWRPHLPGSSMREQTGKSRLDLRVFALFAATFMLYVGVESSLGGWLPTYAQRLAAGSLMAGGLSAGTAMAARASAIALCFWSCELAARSAMAFFLPLVDERLVYRVCLLVLIGTATILAVVPHPGTAAIFAVTAVAAFSLAPLYPLAASFLLGRAGRHPAVGKVFAFASLGGTLLPWITGLLSTHFESLRIGLATPLAGAGLMLALSFCLPRDLNDDCHPDPLTKAPTGACAAPPY